jgi:hypothetical protein
MYHELSYTARHLVRWSVALHGGHRPNGAGTLSLGLVPRPVRRTFRERLSSGGRSGIGEARLRHLDAVKPCCCYEALVIGDKGVEIVTEVQCDSEMDRIQ